MKSWLRPEKPKCGNNDLTGECPTPLLNIMPVLSIIVPIFNTALWLPRCLDSLVGQSLQDIEILCINDGSQDECQEIIRQYSINDKRIQHIDLAKNRGPSVVRNIGIAAARGKFIAFMDSDDAVEQNFYEHLYVKAECGNADIAKGSRLTSSDNGISFHKEELNKRIRENNLNFTWQFTTAIYRKKFITDHGIYFPNFTNYSEDVAFLYKVMLCNPVISLSDTVHYLYFRRNNSLNSEEFTKYKYLSNILSFYDIALFAKQNNINSKIIINILKSFLLISSSNLFKFSTNERQKYKKYYQNFSSAIIELYGTQEIKNHSQSILYALDRAETLSDFHKIRHNMFENFILLKKIKEKALKKSNVFTSS